MPARSESKRSKTRGLARNDAACFISEPWRSRVSRKAGLSATASPSSRTRARSSSQAAMTSLRSAANASTAAPCRQPATAWRISRAIRSRKLSFAAALAWAVPGCRMPSA